MFLGRQLRATLFVLVAGAIVSCVTATTSTTRNPKAPASDWQVYSSLDTGIAVSLPPQWRAFDLPTERETVLKRWVGGGGTESQVGVQLDALIGVGCRFVAIGPTPSGGAAFAYAVYSSRPPEGRDAHVASVRQSPGRTVLLTEHVGGNIGDILHQRVQTAATSDSPSMLEEQFFIERFDSLYVLFVKYEEAAGAEFSAKMTLVGESFTPLR